MANILTAQEAANVLRCETTDPLMLDLLPAINDYLEMATGRDWSADTTIYPQAKQAARILLVQWHEDPGMSGGAVVMSGGLQACLTQLEAKALELLSTEYIPEEELEVVSSFPADGDDEIALTVNIVVIFNHEMASGTTTAVTLRTQAGTSVAVTNTLDSSTKILTINPDASLDAATTYVVELDGALDVYGKQLTETDEIQFTTA